MICEETFRLLCLVVFTDQDEDAVFMSSLGSMLKNEVKTLSDLWALMVQPQLILHYPTFKTSGNFTIQQY
jgi:hypothetical protein